MKIPGITTETLKNIFSRPTKLNYNFDSFNVKAIANKDNVNRVAIIKGKKGLSKSAVIRHRADRRIKSALQIVYPNMKMKGYDVVFYAQPPVITKPWPILLQQVTKAIQSIEKKALFPEKKTKKTAYSTSTEKKK